MTLQEWNARRHALARLEHTGWLNTRLNTLRNIAAYVQAERQGPPQWTQQFINNGRYFAAKIRQYRRRHRFYDCLP